MSDEGLAKMVSESMMALAEEEEAKLTPEEKAERDRKAEEDRVRWEKFRKEQEDAYTFAVPRKVLALRKESAEKLVEADRLEALLKAYPDVKQHTDRWKNVRYFSKTVNTQVNDYELRHSCGCCNDSVLLIYPYIETPQGRVHSDPCDFRVGEKEPYYGGDIPHKGWDKTMRDAGIPEAIIDRVRYHFRSEADEAKAAAERIYDQETEPESEPPL